MLVEHLLAQKIVQAIVEASVQIVKKLLFVQANVKAMHHANHTVRLTVRHNVTGNVHLTVHQIVQAIALLMAMFVEKTANWTVVNLNAQIMDILVVVMVTITRVMGIIVQVTDARIMELEPSQHITDIMLDLG